MNKFFDDPTPYSLTNILNENDEQSTEQNEPIIFSKSPYYDYEANY